MQMTSDGHTVTGRCRYLCLARCPAAQHTTHNINSGQNKVAVTVTVTVQGVGCEMMLGVLLS